MVIGPEKQSSASIEVERQQEEWQGIEEELAPLSKMESASGHENKVREYLLAKAEELDIKTEIDDKGNVWFLSDEPEGEILLTAHMDKIGKGSELEVGDQKITGRLDDALGMAIILDLFKDGQRPSALFTVEEESEHEVAEDGETKVVMRDLKDGIFNAGARFAADRIENGDVPLPKLVVVADVSSLGKRGKGPLVYASAAAPTMRFRFPSGPLQEAARIINREKLGVNHVEGKANDSIEFAFPPLKGVIAVEVPADNLHSSQEVADKEDIIKAKKALAALIDHHDEIPVAKEKPLHAQPRKGPFEL